MYIKLCSPEPVKYLRVHCCNDKPIIVLYSYFLEENSLLLFVPMHILKIYFIPPINNLNS